MNNRNRLTRSGWWGILGLSLFALTLGIAYYVFARATELQPYLITLLAQNNTTGMNILGGSLPSFVHAFALFLILSFALKSNNTSRIASFIWLGAAFVALMAGEILIGTTTALDIVALAVAICLALVTVRQMNKAFPMPVNLARWFPVVSIVGFGVLGVASEDFVECARFDDDGVCVENVQRADPVYMSYETLRSSVRVEEARPMDDVGRIYSFQNLLFVNERNRGIHVIDNVDPFEPNAIGFINIPGNLDIVIRGDRLYADSFIDLVTLDISNPDDVTVVDRQVEVFPWDENQNIPYNIRLNFSEIDRNLGVVIAYEVTE